MSFFDTEKMRSLKGFLYGKSMHGLIVGMIILDVLLIGLMKSQGFSSSVQDTLRMLDAFLITILSIEILVRFFLGPRHFFLRGWNIFDAMVIGITLLSFTEKGHFLSPLRLLLLLRLVELMPHMRYIIHVLRHSLSGLGTAFILFIIFYYGFSLAAYEIFHTQDADHFGSLSKSFWTLFSLMTFDNLSGVIVPLMKTMPWAWLFFVSYLVLTSFSILNLIVGILVQTMQEATKESFGISNRNTPRNSKDQPTFESVLRDLGHIKRMVSTLEKKNQEPKA